MGGMLGLATYGGRINSVAPACQIPAIRRADPFAQHQQMVDATASAQRDSILDIACTTGWLDPREEAKNPGMRCRFGLGDGADRLPAREAVSGMIAADCLR